MEARSTGAQPRHTLLLPSLRTSLLLTLILGVWYCQALEMITGKIPYLEAVNGSTVLLPCKYASCVGIKDLYFRWSFNDTDPANKLVDAWIKDEFTEPAHLTIYKDRVEFVGSTKTQNVSILLWNITFEDGGVYTCYGKNPKEKGRYHNSTFTLSVVDELRVVDNTLTILIASCVGGTIASLMGFVLIKNFIIFVISKVQERNKECLVTSSGIDNTENGLSGSKSTPKPTPKKAPKKA
ncbi:sodium channel, voltage-gated, type IV, beta b [Clupea harengus]|uniref:Sodium channel, voltage-gated, type IV, beta b n=1 Tax=Clupea harengus TaxID=7950 RepID=A0A6P3VXT5_CLUHA|nr:sodium channel, voltage-gated, type IV, beta b [Clupea harengus]